MFGRQGSWKKFSWYGDRSMMLSPTQKNRKKNFKNKMREIVSLFIEYQSRRGPISWQIKAFLIRGEPTWWVWSSNKWNYKIFLHWWAMNVAQASTLYACRPRDGPQTFWNLFMKINKFQRLPFFFFSFFIKEFL